MKSTISTPAGRSPSQPIIRRALVGLACGVLIGLTAASRAPAAPPAQNVRLVIDYGDGAELHLNGIAWRDGLTAFDVLSAAQKHPHGVRFRHRGSGALAKVEQIGDLTNEGNGKNWIYSVNGKQGEVGSGAYQLKAGDTILWKFQAYE